MIFKSPKKFDYRKIAELSSLVLMLPSSIAVGLFFGYVLDKWLGTEPWLLLLFTILGIIRRGNSEAHPMGNPPSVFYHFSSFSYFF